MSIPSRSRPFAPIARARRLRVVSDGEGWRISGRPGQIEYHDGAALAVYTDRPRLFARLWAFPGVRRWQVGDQEGRGLFPVEALPAVARLIRGRRRRILSPELARQRVPGRRTERLQRSGSAPGPGSQGNTHAGHAGVDGASHKTALGQARDATKTAILNGLGWRVLRFQNREVLAEGAEEHLELVDRRPERHEVAGALRIRRGLLDDRQGALGLPEIGEGIAQHAVGAGFRGGLPLGIHGQGG